MIPSLLVLIALLLTGSSARAWEFSRNPDRFPSVGLTVLNDKLRGDQSDTVVDSAGREFTLRDNESKVYASEVGGDVRLPVSQGVTLTFMYSRLETERYFTRYSTFLRSPSYKEHGTMDGDRFGFNVRVYFNK